MKRSFIKGTSTIIYTNDSAYISAALNAGRTIEEARDYFLTGCWGFVSNQEKFDHGNYLNILKPFEYAIHNLKDKMDYVGIEFETLEDCKTFEEMYDKVIRNTDKLLQERIRVTKEGGHILHNVDRMPIYSATLENCIENRAEYIMGGAKYRDDYYLMFGLPNIVDSLLAIKTLVYDEKKYTLEEMLTAIRNNWEGNEMMRQEAMACHGWGDGNADSCGLAKRFNSDLYKLCQKSTGGYGGKVHMGHLTYTEVRWWGEKTLATPDGRHNGEYFRSGTDTIKT